MDQLLTVLVQTSPVPSHPSTALLEALFRSFQKADGLLESRVIVVCDGCETVESGDVENHKHGKASLDTAQRYRDHLQLLKRAVESQTPPFVPSAGGSIEVLLLKDRHGSARAIQAVFSLQMVTTPMVMIAQHDNVFVQSVPVRACTYAMHQRPSDLSSLGVKCLHWMSTATLDYANKVKQRYGLDISTHTLDHSLQLLDEEEVLKKRQQHLQQHNTSPQEPSFYKLVPLVFWYGRTHLSYRDHYQNVILKGKSFRTGDHLEELLGVVQLYDIQTRGIDAAHPDYGTFVLDQGCGQVMYHLSGRRARAVTADHQQHDDENENVATRSLTQSATLLQGVADNNKTNCNNDEHPPKKQSSPGTTLQPGSFTTAKSFRAIVPGLEIVSEAAATEAKIMSRQQANQPLPPGRFKQKCFHCGVKGHSYKFCPAMKEPPVTETIDLS